MSKNYEGIDLPKTMKAVVCHAPHDYRLEEVPVPTPGPEEVVLRIKSTGICASDIKCYDGAAHFWGDEYRPTWIEAPVIPGHEFVGEVVALGAGAGEKYGLEIGDHATSEQIVPYGDCKYTREGHYWMDVAHKIYGFKKYTQGSWAEYCLLPKGALNYKVPKDIPLHHAAFIEPLGCSLHAVERGDIKFRDTVVVAGCGPLGLGMIIGAKLKGAGQVVALDMKDDRLEIARESGADVTINIQKEDAIQRVRDMTDGYGCDVYIEATGHPAAVDQGLQMIRKLGTFVEFSVMREQVKVDWTIIGDGKELNIHGAHLSPYTYPKAIEIIQKGLLPMDKIVTHRLPLSDFQEGIDMVINGLTSVKVTLEP